MAVTVTDLRTTRDEADATTSWTGSITPSLFTSGPDPVEATGHLGGVVSNAFGYWVHAPGGSVNLTNTLVYVWALPGPAMATLTNHGFGIVLSDGTNIIQYNLGGSDVAVFRHNSGLPTYQCMVLDTSSLPASTRAHAGSAGSINLSAITGIGVGFTTTLKAVGGVANCFSDIVRYGNSGLRVTGGTSGTPGLFSEIAALDASTATTRAHGVIRQLASGLFGVQGPLVFGGTGGASWFEDKNVTIVFESRGLLTTRYGITIQDDGTNTATFRLGTKVGSGSTATGTDGVALTAPTGVGAFFDADTDTDVTDVFIYGSTFSGFTGGIGLRAGHEFIGCVVNGSGAIRANGATCVNTDVIGSTVAANASALIWNVNTNPNGLLDGMSFTKGANAHHAIEFGLNSPTTLDLTNVNFSGFNAANGQNDSTLHILRTTGTVTINISGGNTPSYRSEGATVVINNTVSITISGLIATSELTIVRTSDETVLFHVESTGTSENYSHDGSSVNVDILVFHLDYEPVALNVTLGGSAQNIPIQQIVDLVYSNPAGGPTVPGYMTTGAANNVRAATVDAPAYSTGIIEWIGLVACSDWHPGSFQTISMGTHRGQWSTIVRGWTTAGDGSRLQFDWHDGSSLQAAQTNAGLPLFDSYDWVWIRYVFNPDNGANYTFDGYYSLDPVTTDPGSVSWTQVGTQVTGTSTTLRAATSTTTGVGGDSPLSGGNPDDAYFRVVSAFHNGSEIIDPDWRDGDQGWASLPATDSYANDWDLINGAAWVAPS